MKLIKLFITYIKKNEKNGNIYAGHASGTVPANFSKKKSTLRIMRKRD